MSFNSPQQKGKNRILRIILLLFSIILLYSFRLCGAEASSNPSSEIYEQYPIFGLETPITCFGILSNSSFVCSGQGSCIATDSCLCNQDYFGSNCSYAVRTARTITTGDETSHFIGYANAVYSTGSNIAGEIGEGSDALDILIPTKHADYSDKKAFIAVAGGCNHFLKLDSNNTLYAWGNGGYGELGNNSTKNARVPVKVDTSGVLKGKKIVDMCGGLSYSVAIDDEGIAYSWGTNEYGGLGDPTVSERWVPGLVKSSGILSGKKLRTIHCSQTTAMALDSNNTLVGWGYNYMGQMARQESTTIFGEAIVIQRPPNSTNIVAFAVGTGHTLVVDNTGTVYSVGWNNYGQLGDKNRASLTQWTKVYADDALKGKVIVGVFAYGQVSACVDSDGRMYTWGYGYFGTLGLGDVFSRNSPSLVTKLPNSTVIVEVSIGAYHVIARDSLRRNYVFGFNQNGQLGTSDRGSLFTPTRMNCPVGLQRATCDEPTCGNDYGTCSGHGTCIAPLTCQCEPNYFGEHCEEWTCDGIPSNQTAVCNKKGQCTGYNKCEYCENPWLFGVIYLNFVFMDPKSFCKDVDWKATGKFLRDYFVPAVLIMTIATCPPFLVFVFGAAACGGAPPCCLFIVGILVVLCCCGVLILGLVLLFVAFGLGGGGFVVLLILCIICGLPCVGCCTLCAGCLASFALYKIKQRRDKERFIRKLVEGDMNGEESEESGPSFKFDKSIFNLEFKDFKITQEIPTGGSGALCLEASDKRNDEDVFIKLFPMKKTDDGEYDLKEFSNEISFLSTLRHPNIVNFFGVFYSPPARVGYVCEFCKAGALSSFLKKLKDNDKTKKKQQFNLAKKLDWLIQIGKGMRYLHQKDVIFRDLKPENVLIGKGDVLKITDFGISRLRNDKTRSSNMTMKAGTSFYMAPEVVNPNLLPKGEMYDFKVDVFSFGILMFEVLFETMEPYSEQSNQYGIEFQVCQNPDFRPIIDMSKLEDLENISIDEQILEKMETMMRNCWSHDPKKRPNFREIVNDISEIQDSLVVM